MTARLCVRLWQREAKEERIWKALSFRQLYSVYIYHLLIIFIDGKSRCKQSPYIFNTDFNFINRSSQLIRANPFAAVQSSSRLSCCVVCFLLKHWQRTPDLPYRSLSFLLQRSNSIIFPLYFAPCLVSSLPNRGEGLAAFWTVCWDGSINLGVKA